ncbi:EFR1 family ferrodoxin [uncultured Desulfosarcina sp.]|uniref:EFR1 family ferrodoxin n=1 Tax=uncultured Desulfosarcina sp. TaxID=218289 RepID=UPI0029C74C88|nr:EFR1 family ferrodoxin [uncultured Desulfosarcina sp.]
MEVKQVKLVYFSPTGTTQKVLEGIAKGIGVEGVEQINLTLPEGTQQAIPPFADELVIIGAPVYGGRLPVDAIKRLNNLKATNTLAVLVVVYGNREFEDALLELKNLSIELGFSPVAGAAFIGEHSFATADVPIANGRPDSQDVQRAMDFGARIKDKIAALESPDAKIDLELPGNFPYEAGGARPMAVAPVTIEDTCTVCGTCASVCPTAAISINGSVATEIELCIRCCACIKSCPEGARVMEDSKWKSIATWLNENCSARKEPQLFGVGV